MRALETHDLKTLKFAKTAIDEIVASRYLGVQAVPALAPTDFGQLPLAEQHAELQLAQDHDLGNRVRAAIHMCLSAASVSIEVAQKLMEAFPDLPREQQATLLAKCAEDAVAASDAAQHAAAVLAHEESPETEAFFEFSRFG